MHESPESLLKCTKNPHTWKQDGETACKIASKAFLIKLMFSSFYGENNDKHSTQPFKAHFKQTLFDWINLV